jgi:hypothetical protein
MLMLASWLGLHRPKQSLMRLVFACFGGKWKEEIKRKHSAAVGLGLHLWELGMIYPLLKGPDEMATAEEKRKELMTRG